MCCAVGDLLQTGNKQKVGVTSMRRLNVTLINTFSTRSYISGLLPF